MVWSTFAPVCHRFFAKVVLYRWILGLSYGMVYFITTFKKVLEQNRVNQSYPVENSHIHPENHQLLVETHLPTPIYQGLCEFAGRVSHKRSSPSAFPMRLGLSKPADTSHGVNTPWKSEHFLDQNDAMLGKHARHQKSLVDICRYL